MSNYVDVFTNIYETCHWGNNYNPNYKGSSGDGSNIHVNINTYVLFLRGFIKDNGVKTVVDLGCGDFRCGQYIYDDMEDVTYYGYDAYDKVVESNKKTSLERHNFTHLDFFNKKEEIIGADLCILKDVIQHWPLADIYTFLDYLVASKKYKYILITNCCDQKTDDTDIAPGEWRALSCNYLPLKKYGAVKKYSYYSKEVSLIVCN